MPNQYVDKILKAHVYDVAKETPLDFAPVLSTRLDNKVFLKREDLQPVFSFKLRGAYNKMASLTEAQKKQGVIAASAGNHAQGVALAAQKLGVHALIVMPKTSPPIKVKAVQRFGAKTELVGDTFDEAYAHAMALAKEKNFVFIPPYDDPEIIAGQGTVAMEILKQHPDPIDAIFVPVGGGGLIAGISAYVKYVRPEIRVIGVEPVDAACLYEALKHNKRVALDQVGLFADGVAVRQIGEEPFRVAKQCVDEVILVSSDEICAAVKDIFDNTRSIAEPSGAVALAGLKKYVHRDKLAGKTLVAIDSGANVNFDRLRHIAERAELGERREALLAVTIAEKPGSFRSFCKTLGKRALTEFNYRLSDPGNAYVFVGVELSKGDVEKDAIVQALEAADYPVLDMTDNEMAKLHIRHMVGGRIPVQDERLFRFEFPERPGALLNFLNHLGQNWNISLFHYRNQGAAYGRVLVGIQVPAKDNPHFETFLKNLAYPFTEESDNPAYAIFLK
ncbi:MAG: threonine ammonia-lyase, biosynthetic [Candidatus Margulisiibacteriota bacterium]